MAPLDGLAAITLLSTLPGGQQCANTFHISKESAGAPPSPADLAQLAADIDAYMTTDYRAILSVGSTFNAIKLAQVPDPTIHADPYADYLLPKNLAGTRTTSDTSIPTQACACLSLKTNSGQRSYRGHLLMPSNLDSAQMSGQKYNTGAAYYEACNTFAALLTTGCGSSPTWTGTLLHTYTLSIYSKTLQMRAEPSVTACVVVVANAAVHWLRSRGRGTT